MEKYDVIIIGAGIAGTSLAYNIHQECPNKKVLIIDKLGLGSEAGFGYRNIPEEEVKEYSLPYEHSYTGVKAAVKDKVLGTVNKKYFFCHYKKICRHLLIKSNSTYKKEEAIEKINNTLITNKKAYQYNFLIDCSGHSVFLRKKLNLMMPKRYWIGKLRIFKNTMKLKKDFFYFSSADNWRMEDIYPIKDKILQGDWIYSKTKSLKPVIESPNYTFYTKHKKQIKNSKKSFGIEVVSPLLPLVYKNIAFLGDSFGNAYPMSCEGISPILKTSKLLSRAISKNNLMLFEKKWKKTNLDKYLKQFASKCMIKNRIKFFKAINKDPRLLKKIFEKKELELSAKVIMSIGIITTLKIFFYFLYLKISYRLYSHKYKRINQNFYSTQK